MARVVILLGAGALLGLLAGYLLFSGGAVPTPAPAPVDSGLIALPPASSMTDSPREPQPSSPAAADGGATPSAPSAGLPSSPDATPPSASSGEPDGGLAAASGGAGDTAALQRRVAELEHQLELERKLRKEQEGQEIKKPPNLPARFEADSIRSSLSAAFKELGLTAEVTSIDCTEYPCIAYGEGFGSHQDSQALSKASAMSGYADDSRSVWGWGSEKDGEGRQFFGIALLPKGDADSSDLRRRVEFRVRQMRETLR